MSIFQAMLDKLRQIVFGFLMAIVLWLQRMQNLMVLLKLVEG